MKHNIFNHGIYGLLVNSAPNRVFISVALSTLAGLLQVILIPLLVMSFDVDSSDGLVHINYKDNFEILGISIRTPGFALFFFTMCFLILLLRSGSGRMMSEVVTRLVLEIKRDIYQKINGAPVQDVERIGFSSLLAVLTTDIEKIAIGTRAIPLVINYVVVLLGVIILLGIVNFKVMLFILGCTLFGILCYQPFSIFGNKAFIQARHLINRIVESNKAIILGSKELKLSEKKKKGFITELQQMEEAHRKLQLRGSTLFMVGAQFSGMMIMLIIGIVAFALSNFYSLSSGALISIVMILLYLSEPLLGIVECVSSIFPARIALFSLMRNMRGLGVEIENQHSTVSHNKRVRQIHLKNMSYCFGTGAEKGFSIGPISLSLEAGQVTFITGGNGSGKSTLGKVISLLYNKESGDIYFDGSPVTNDSIADFRKNIAAIFTDFYLFPRLYDVSAEQEQKIPEYLKELMLEEKVTITNGELSTTSLSDGQRKRIALLVSYLEDKDVYVFDEWAADQDPQFKKVFYTSILSKLKAKGKIVIVITHDDRYFNLADQLVKMESGKIVSILDQRQQLNCVNVA
ncbi:MAG: cyclic peptide export ABC transporter [Pseudomonadota bacterium]